MRTTDEWVDYFIDENGLALYIDLLWKNADRSEWDWITTQRHIQGLTKGHLTFSPQYLEELYDLQKSRLVA